MWFCYALLAGLILCVSSNKTTPKGGKKVTVTEEQVNEEDEYEKHTFFATIDPCVGLDPPINNREYLDDVRLSVSSKSLSDVYRNVSVKMYLRRSLLDNSLLHFYITDEELYSYQCMNRNSCTYKLCNPETSQEKTLTKRWHGRCPLLPGFYEYKFVYKLPPRILYTKRKTTVLNIQAQLHEGYVCVACYKIRMMFRKKTKL